MDGCDVFRRGGDEAADDFEVDEARRAEGGASKLGDRSELMSMPAAERRAEGGDGAGRACDGRMERTLGREELMARWWTVDGWLDCWLGGL
jgi:hypothetical protein